MKPEDSATFYYCFTKLGFLGHGEFYKYLQKSVTKTIRGFEGPTLRLMFYKFDHEEECRLNRGVRGRLIDHCKYLVREQKLKGFDANEIYEHTKLLAYEAPQRRDEVIDLSNRKIDETSKKKHLHELPFILRNYLEKIKYFN